jgi:hypothetical protein
VKWIEDQKSSGLPIAEFCQSIGSSANSFYWRRRRLAETSDAISEMTFAEIQQSPFVAIDLAEAGPAAPVEVDLPGGVVVHVRDSHAVHSVIKAGLEHGGRS